MKKQRLFAHLLAAAIVLNLLCVFALAAGEPDIAISYDMASGTVNVKAFGLEAGSSVSLMGWYDNGLDYLNQYAADDGGNLDVTYPSSVEWANGGVIKAQVGAEGLDGPIVKTVVISSDAPYIKEYTNGLTYGYAANVLVAVGNPAAGLTAEIAMGGKIYAADVSGGSALVKVTDVIKEANLALVLKSGGEVLQTRHITINPEPENLWTPSVSLSGSDLRIIFAAKISEGVKGYSAILNDKAALSISKVGDQALQIDNVSLMAENTVIVSGVKYPDYFPSYSFTFSIKF